MTVTGDQPVNSVYLCEGCGTRSVWYRGGRQPRSRVRTAAGARVCPSCRGVSLRAFRESDLARLAAAFRDVAEGRQ